MSSYAYSSDTLLKSYIEYVYVKHSHTLLISCVEQVCINNDQTPYSNYTSNMYT